MKQIKIILTCFVIAIVVMSSCGSDDNIPKYVYYEEDNSASKKINVVYEMFGLKRDAFVGFGTGANINLSNKSVSMADVRKSDSKLFVCVFDSLLNSVVLKDSMLTMPKEVSETYYDKQLTFELSRVHPNYYRTNKGGIVVADIAYITGNGPSAYRPVAYFIDMAGDSVTRRDTSLMPHCDFSGLMQWENDDVIMSFRNQNTGYDYVVYTYAGDEKLAFGSNENLFERNSNQYCLSERDFVTYRVESYQIYASRQVVKSGRLEKKWERWISLPDELNNARVKAYPKVADGKITFDVVAMLRNGETRKLRYLFDLETGNNF